MRPTRPVVICFLVSGNLQSKSQCDHVLKPCDVKALIMISTHHNTHVKCTLNSTYFTYVVTQFHKICVAISFAR